MRVNEFTISLLEKLEADLLLLSQKETDEIRRIRKGSSLIIEAIAGLKVYVCKHPFADVAEEICFFKTLKPQFLSKLIYHQKVFAIHSNVPVADSDVIKKYYLHELEKIDDYYKRNSELLTYYKSQATSFDEMYFVRKEPDSWLLLNFDNYEADLNFTTIYDHKISKFIAYEMVSEYVKRCIASLNAANATAMEVSFKKQPVNWTGSKVSLVELLYALQSAGSCNNGTIDLKQLANHFEQTFNVDLGNYYRVFQEMRIRKLNRTTFLDQLKTRLTQRMDEADENPRFM